MQTPHESFHIMQDDWRQEIEEVLLELRRKEKVKYLTFTRPTHPQNFPSHLFLRFSLLCSAACSSGVQILWGGKTVAFVGGRDGFIVWLVIFLGIAM